MENTPNDQMAVEDAENKVYTVRRDTFITELDISGRTINVLHANNIWTVGELMVVLEDQDGVSSWQGVGKMVFEELKGLLPKIVIEEPLEEEVMAEGDNSWKVIVLNREMLSRIGELKIQKSEISPRTYAKLKREEMENLFYYLDISPDQLRNIKNIGVKTAQLICTTITERAYRTYISSFDGELKDDQIVIALVDAYGRRISGYVKIDDFLDKIKYNTGFVSDWLKPILREQTGQLNNQVADVVCFYNGDGCVQRREVATRIEQAYRSLEIDPGKDAYLYFLARILSVPKLSEGRTMIDERSTLVEPLRDIFINNDVVLRAIRTRIVNELRQKCTPISREQLGELIPEILRDSARIDEVLDYLVKNENILVQDNLYMLKYETVRSWIEHYPDERKRQILELRLNGGTLEDVGHTVNLTRERVRQIVWNCLVEARFQEDYLGPIYEKYRFDDEQARLAFGTIEGNYLIVRYKKGKLPLEDAVEDETIPFSVRESIEKALERDYIFDGPYLVRRQNNDVKMHLIRTRCVELVTVTEYINLYYDFCKQFNLDPQVFSLDDQSIANKLHDSRITITTYGRKFRYYPIDTVDFTDLYEGLKLRAYKDIELSTQLFFRMYPELMKQYDIRDACELHNALKKSINPEEFPDISFGRMPIMRFGNPSREKQVVALLMDNAPEIENSELAKLYEERYGVNTASFMANYAPFVQDFFFEGQYKLNVSQLPEEDAEKMRAVLTEDFYLMDTIRNLYKETIPGATGNEIVPLTVRQLGYHPYEGYAIRADKYRKSTDYIEHLLLDKEEIYVSEFPEKLTALPLFSRLYMGLKQNFEIFEVGMGHLIRLSYFEERGVTKKDFEKYIDHVSRFPIEDRFFSIRSLHKAGFRDPLDKLKMDDWFYASVLQQRPEQFSLQRVSGAKIICKGHNPFNAATVFEQVIRENGPMSPEKLIDFMNKTHGTDVNRGRMLFLITAANLYYDRLTKTIYLRDEMLEELLRKRREDAEAQKNKTE